ncbi:hypothetical protein EDB19DRAFT_968016 [Suillus lakei]|nr:hypothetical protein EDB19DRAFT_968016 [Suillus lakei]
MHIFQRSANDFDARLVIGPIQVGGLLSAALFGCLACQTYVYFARFTSDHLALRAAVYAVIFIQLGHFVCIISTLWTMTVSTYGDPSQLQHSLCSHFTHIDFGGCVKRFSCPFFAKRSPLLHKFPHLFSHQGRFI